MDKRVLVVPQFNESRSIVRVLNEACNHVDAIIVVDDGSTDESHLIVEEWMQGKEWAFVIRLEKNRGMSGALLAGLCHVHGLLEEGAIDPDDLVITIDADGQHRPEEIPAAVEFLKRHGYDIVLARRDLSGYPRFKRVGNWGLSLWASLLGGVRYHDVECGFRVMRVAVLPHLLKYFTGLRYGCAQEIGIITALLGFQISNDLPAHINYYRAGARMRDGLVNLAMGLLAFLRVKMGISNNLCVLSKRASLGTLMLEPAAALESGPDSVKPRGAAGAGARR